MGAALPNYPVVPDANTVGIVGVSYTSENGKTYECVAVIDNSTVKPNGEKVTKLEYVWVCTSEGAGGASGSENFTFTITPVDGQVSPNLSATRAEMLAALDAGKTLLGYWTETQTVAQTTIVTKHEFRLESVNGTGADRGLTFVNYEQFYKSTLYVNGNDTISFVDKEQLPNPMTKTEAMTQSVGMDDDGRLWTEPGASGLPEGATAFQQLVTDSNGSAVWDDRPGGYTQKYLLVEYVYPSEEAPNFRSFCQKYHKQIGDTLTVVCNGVTYENVTIQNNGDSQPMILQAGVFYIGRQEYYGGGAYGDYLPDTFPEGVSSVTFKDVSYEIDVEVPEKYLATALSKKLNRSGYVGISGSLAVYGPDAAIHVTNSNVQNSTTGKHAVLLGDGASIYAPKNATMSGTDGCIRVENRSVGLEIARYDDDTVGSGYAFFYGMNNQKILVRNVATPTIDSDAANKKYVDDTKLIVSSSTEGSTKKFKITVDDTGALTATEVTTMETT